jgi:restriction system protein
LQVHQQGIIITTSDFSKGARAEATASNKTHIGLIDGEELVGLLVKHKIGVQEKNLPVLSLDDGWWGELAGQTAAVEPGPAPEQPPAQGAKARKGGADGKPASFRLFDKVYPLATWRGLLLQVCSDLAQRRDDFAEVAVTVHGRSRQYIAPAPTGMIDPLPIPGTGLWLEANQSRRSALQVVALLLQAFELPQGTFRLSGR